MKFFSKVREKKWPKKITWNWVTPDGKLLFPNRHVPVEDDSEGIQLRGQMGLQGMAPYEFIWTEE